MPKPWSGRSAGLRRRETTVRPFRGFTLVELLVVITIIGILVALLLPAVQAAREAARRVQCQNHLKQLSLASLQHVDKHGFFPTGGWGWHWVGDPDRGFDKRQPGGWVYNILPYLEQENLYDLGKGEPWSQKKSAGNELAKTPLSATNCPTRRRSILYPKPVNGTYVARNANNNTSSENLAARGDYAANSGSQSRDEYFAGPGSYQAGDSPGFGWHNTKNSNGISFERSEVRTAHILDGTSNTIMLGEKYLMPEHYASGRCAADNENMFTGYNNDNYRSTHSAYTPRQDRSGWNSTKHFGSAHAAGCHFALCDGSVRTIRFWIDGTTFSRLGNRRDGKAVDWSKL